MSSGQRRCAEDDEEERFLNHVRRLQEMDVVVLTRRLEEAQEMLDRLYELDVPLSRTAVRYLKTMREALRQLS